MNRHRNLIFVSLSLFILGFAFLASPHPAAANPTVLLQQCANDDDGSNPTCANGPNLGWMNSQINGNNGFYALGDFYPNRQVFNGLVVGNTYCFGFGFDYSKGALPAVDYVGTYNYSIPADPTVDTNFTLADSTDTVPIPQEPATLNGGTIGGGTYNGLYIPGELTLWGGTFVPVTGSTMLVYSNPGSGNLDTNFQQSIEYCFQAGTTQAVLAWGAHISIPQEWGSAERPTGSPYHVSNGTRNGQFTGPRTGESDLVELDATGGIGHNNIGRREQQIQDSAVGDPGTLAIGLSAIETSSANLPFALGLVFIFLAFTTGWIARRPLVARAAKRRHEG